MPDILIRGAKMPTSCYSCEIGPADQMEDCCPFFSLTGEEQKAYQTKRHENCPVSKLPPHGELIDRDALLEIGSDLWVVYDEGSGVDEAFGFSNDVIINAPVIVPAEGSEP